MAENTLQYGIQIAARRVNEQAFAQTEADIKRLDKAAAESAKIMSGQQQAMAGMVGGMGGLFQLAAQQFEAYKKGIKESLGGIKEMVTSVFAGRPSDMLEQFFGGMGKAGGGAIGKFGLLFEPLGDAVSSFGQTVGGVLGGIMRAFENLVAGVIKGAMAIGEALLNFAVAAFERLKWAAETALKVAAVGLAALIGVVAMGVKTFADYEQSVRNAGTVTGLMGEQLKEAETSLADFGRQVARESSFMPTEVAKAFYSLASAGFTTKQTMEATRGVVALAEATMSDMGQSAEIVTQAINAFRLSASDATRVSNLFAAAISASPLNMERLAAAFPYAAAMASAFKMSIEETTGALMALAKAGITGSMAGTSLRGVLGELSSQGDKGKEILAKYGLTLEMISPTVHGFAEAIDRVAKANMSAADMMEVFGKRSGPAMLILTREGKPGLDALTASITGTSRALEMQKAQLDNAHGAWKLLKSTTQEALMALGGATTKGLEGVVRAVNEAMLGMADKGVFAGIGGGIGAFVGALFGGVEKIGPVLASVGEKLKAFFDPENMKAMGEATRDFIDKVWKFATETLPLLWQWGQAVFSDMYRWLQEKVPAGITTLVEGVRDLGLQIITLGETIEGTFRSVAGALGGVLTWIGEMVGGVGLFTAALSEMAQMVGRIGTALHIPGAKELLGIASGGDRVTKLGAGISGAGAALQEWGDATGWQEKYAGARTSWRQRTDAFGQKASSTAGMLLDAGGTMLPMTPQEAAVAKERGVRWAQALLDVVEKAMGDRLREYEQQKARNTLRPAFP